MDNKVKQTNGQITHAVTLLQYENPVLIRDAKGPVKRRLMRPDPTVTENTGFPQAAKIPGLVGTTTGSHDYALNKEEMSQILDIIFPTKEWVEGDGKVWQQKISSVPAGRPDVRNLEETLDMRLRQQQVRRKGICPIRHYLYAQVFDELIRQVIIESAERGLLLVRIREEIRMTIAAYEELLGNAIDYGVRKSILAEEGIAELEGKIKALEDERVELEETYQQILIDIELEEREHQEKKKSVDKNFVDEVTMIKRSNQQLKMLLDTVNAFSKK